MIGDKLTQRVLAIPRDVHLVNITILLVDYRGRIAITLDNDPSVCILGKVIRARFDQINERVILFVNLKVKGGDQITADFYPRLIRDYYLVGTKEESPLSQINFEHCPARARLLDL
ncbi:MAG: hypothetical protein K9L31_01270 [Candidatus Pacebacteria bacterium]|nr:hypothetical protein [Candidatus Paceibacterota bacterium]